MRLHAFLNENHACFTACICQSLPLTSVYVLWTRFTNGKLPGVKRKSGLTLMWPTHSRLQSWVISFFVLHIRFQNCQLSFIRTVRSVLSVKRLQKSNVLYPFYALLYSNLQDLHQWQGHCSQDRYGGIRYSHNSKIHHNRQLNHGQLSS